MVELIFFPFPCLLFLELHLKTRTARVLLDYLIKEIDIVKMCTDCYRNANIREMGWFTHVCRKPHLIVWTKRCDYNYWPAKVMSTNGDGDVMLQFFGNHTKANVCAASSCFLYSRENPGHSNVSSYLYKSALKVSKERSVLTKIDFFLINLPFFFCFLPIGSRSIHCKCLQKIRFLSFGCKWNGI